MSSTRDKTLHVIATCTICGTELWNIPNIPALDRWPIEANAPSTVFCKVEEHNTGRYVNYNFTLTWETEEE